MAGAWTADVSCQCEQVSSLRNKLKGAQDELQKVLGASELTIFVLAVAQLRYPSWNLPWLSAKTFGLDYSSPPL